jgi:hypothetical protein
MWWTRGGRRRRRGNAMVCMAPMTRTESTGPYSMVSGSSSAPTGPHPRGRPCPAHRNSFHRHRLCAAWGQAAEPAGAGQDPRDRGVDVAPAGRDEDVEVAVSVKLDRLQLRLPAPGEQRANRQHNRRGGARSLARADGQRKWRRASRRARSLRSRAGAGADIARARPRARAPAACAPPSRAQRQGRPKLRRMRGGRPGWGTHLWMVGWYPWALKRLVTT